MIASSKRNIKSGSQYNQYFDLGSLQNNEVSLMPDGGVEDTIKEMKRIAARYKKQTARIASVLKGKTTLDTARNIWNFVYNHIQYKKDNPLREQIRTPLRTWADRATGVDCDCYSVFISSILQNLNIAHAYRIAAYGADYQHVYVVVPDKGRDIIIDCVADSFNYEVPPTKKKDFTVMGATSLNGLGACRADGPAVVYMDEEKLIKRGYVFTTRVLDELGIAYVETINDNGNVPQIETTLKGKAIVLPTAITRERAAQLKAEYLSRSTQPTNGLSGIEVSGSTVLKTLGIGALLYWFFTGGEETKDKPGLAGPGAKRTAKKLSVINI